ncbi:MAG: RNA ligase family protein [archaeon]
MIIYPKLWKETLKLKSISYNEFLTKYPKVQTWFQEKIDGEVNALIYHKDHDIYLQSTTGKEKRDLPVVYQCKEILDNLNVKHVILIGELVAIKNNEILPFNQSESIVKRHYLPSNKDLIHLFLIDVFKYGNKSLDFQSSVNFFKNNFKGTHIHIPKTKYGGIRTFRTLFNETINTPGKEGVVIRDLKGQNFKIRYTSTVDVAIIGAGRKGMIAWERGEISYLITAFVDKYGNYRRSSNIGTGFTTNLRIELFNYIKRNYLYEENGEFFLSPKKSFVVELKYGRFRITDVPIYTFHKKKYQLKSEEKGITFSFPTFVRFRNDKDPKDIFDTRLEQIPDFRY